MFPEKTTKAIINALVRKRNEKNHIAGETTSVCFASMILHDDRIGESKAAERLIRSIFKRNNLSNRRATYFIKYTKSMSRKELAKSLMRFRPYKEANEWLKIESGELNG